MADSGCDWVKAELAEVRRGRASGETTARVERHLAGCAACRAEAAWDERLSAVMQTAPTGHDVEARVHRLIRRRQVLRRSALAVAAAAVVGVASLAILEGQGIRLHHQTVQVLPNDAGVMKEVSRAVSDSPVMKLRVDRQHDQLLAELEMMIQGDKR